MTSRTSLAALHALVPAAEEIDLAEEAARHRLLRDRGQTEPKAEQPEAAEEPPGEPELSLGQALGLLEHLLGAVPVDEP